MKTKLLITIFGIFLMAIIQVFSSVPVGLPGEIPPESQFANGKVLTVKISCEELSNSLLGEQMDRKVSVYLPPGYDENGKANYPVIYMLSDFDGTNEDWFQTFGQHDFPSVLDKLILSEKIKPMILVFPDGKNKYGGAWYSNSSLVGNWEGFIVNDLVTYIDDNFKTLPFSISRGIAGKGMGAHGALKLATKYPGVFSSVFALNAVVDFNTIFTSEHIWSNSIKTASEALEFPTSDNFANQLLGMSVAFSPNGHNKTVPGNLPKNGEGDILDVVFNKWLENDPLHMIQAYRGKLKALKTIAIDCSTDDPGIMLSRNYSEALNKNWIDHTFSYFAGSESNILLQRITKVMLPLFSTNLSSSLLNCNVNTCHTYSDVIQTTMITDGFIQVTPVAITKDGVSLKSENLVKLNVKANEVNKISLTDLGKGIYSIHGVSSAGFEGEPKIFGLNGGTPKVNICVTDINTGKTLAGCGLNINGTECLTDKNGHFSFESMGKINMCFQKEKYGTLEKSVMIYTDTTLSFSLIRDSYVQAVEKGSSMPIYEATVTHNKKATLTANNGFTTVTNVRDGILNCRVFKTGYFPEIVNIPMKPGTTQIVELTKKKANVTFIVIGENGPKEGVYVHLNDQSSYSDDKGRINFNDVDTRVEYLYSVHDHGYEDVEETFYLEADEYISIKLIPRENKSESIVKSSKTITNSDEFSIQGFKVYPNPAKEAITIETDGKELYKVKLVTQSGTVVYQSIIEGNKHRINMSNLSNGVYFVTVKSNNVNRTQRVMKL